MGKINTRAAAKIVGVSEATMRGWRSRDQGPPFWRKGRGIFYDADEVKRWAKGRVARVVPERG